MEVKKESILLKMTVSEKAILKERAFEKGITVSELIFNALKIKRSKRIKPRLQVKDISKNAA